MKYSEETLKTWTMPLSKTEEERVENTVRMIKNAVASYYKLSGCTVEVFPQGSYANNTNVRNNSDVDICIMLTSTFFCEYVEGKTDKDYGYSSGSITYENYKLYIIEALKQKFGAGTVAVGNKCININANSYHVNADVVPVFQYRDFKIIKSLNPNNYIEGVKYFAKDGTTVINYPKDHIENGKRKNNETNYAYKKLVRIMKHIRNDMVDNNKIDGDKISSFLIECLVWNVPNNIIVGSRTWVETIQNVIVYLWSAIKNEKHKDWGEVSERLYLFHNSRKWTESEVKDFLLKMYDYLEY